MNIVEDWSKIRKHFNQVFSSNLHVAIASVDEYNSPTVTPIGTLFLNKDQTGFFFEIYTSSIPKNSSTNKNICILSVNSGKWFWIKSLFQGRFASYPALKLYGTLGEKREATPIEIQRLEKKMKIASKTKGYQILWGNAPYVRDINFTKAEAIKVGSMTMGL